MTLRLRGLKTLCRLCFGACVSCRRIVYAAYGPPPSLYPYKKAKRSGLTPTTANRLLRLRLFNILRFRLGDQVALTLEFSVCLSYFGLGGESGLVVEAVGDTGEEGGVAQDLVG